MSDSPLHKNQYIIEENATPHIIVRIVGIIAIIYLSVHFNNNPDIYGICIVIISFFVLIKDEMYTIKADQSGIHIKQSNILRFFQTKIHIRFKDVAHISFTPGEFSFLTFLLNLIIRSGVSSNKQSTLIIFKKDGEQITLKNIGSEEDIRHLKKWL